MGGQTSNVCRLELRCDYSAPGAVRAALDDVQGIDDIREDAKLIATELVTNAVVHRRRAENMIDVRFCLGDDRLLISVHNPGSLEQPGPLSRPGPGPAASGMGLLVVQQVARRWGSEWLDGHRVWAELALPA